MHMHRLVHFDKSACSGSQMSKRCGARSASRTDCRSQQSDSLHMHVGDVVVISSS
jgi:hypothetical protein